MGTNECCFARQSLVCSPCNLRARVPAELGCMCLHAPGCVMKLHWIFPLLEESGNPIKYYQVLWDPLPQSETHQNALRMA